MKYQKLSKILFSIITFCFVATPGLAFSAGLAVQFEETPLFKEIVFIPGGAVARFVKVTNTSDVNKDVIIEAINKNDPTGFSGKLNLEIKKGTNVIFSDTLTKFFTAGEVVLSQVNNGSTEQYDLRMSFSPDTDNSFQNATVGFDLLVGFKGDEGATDNPNNGIVNGGGGGGGSFPPGLTISGEGSKQALNEVNEVEITWLTNYASTSAVIYDTNPNTFDFSKGEPSFGYAFYKSGDASGIEKVISHKIILTGLSFGQTYYYRVVSHASPATIGREYSFVMDRSKMKIQQDLDNNPRLKLIASNTEELSSVQSQSDSEVSASNEGGNGASTQDLRNEENQEETSNENYNMASLASFLPDFLKRFNLPPWFSDNILLILAIIISILGYIVWRKGKKEGINGAYLIKYAYFLWAFSAVLFILYFWSFWE
jgi:hypothetical protein